ncbi:unnamed protein product [Calypogeia fissa]
MMTLNGFDATMDFVDVLLGMEGSDKLSDADMISVLWEMIFRGTDTTAILAEWVLAELVLNPNIQKKVRAEVEEIVNRGFEITDAQIAGDDPPDYLDGWQKRLPPSAGPPKRKYLSDSIDYKKQRRPDTKPKIWVPLQLWDEWEALRILLDDGIDTTHATVIEWLLKTTRDTVDGLQRTIAAAEAARGSVEELSSLAEHRGPSASET